MEERMTALEKDMAAFKNDRRSSRGEVLVIVEEIAGAMFGTLTETHIKGMPTRLNDGWVHRLDTMGEKLGTHIEENERFQKDIQRRLANGGLRAKFPLQYKVGIGIAGAAGVAEIVAAIAGRL
jgi:hypothetical protein